MSVTKPRMRGGFAIIESLVAAVILACTTVAFFQGMWYFVKFSHNSSDLLTAEAVAWDAVWKTFNEPLQNFEVHNAPIKQGEREFIQDLHEEEAAQLCIYDTPPRLRMRVCAPLLPDAPVSSEAADELDGTWWSEDLVRISVDLEWGDRAKRHRLSDYKEMPVVYRGGVRRAFPR